MRKALAAPLLVVGLLGLCAGRLEAEEARVVELAMPRDLREDEVVDLQVTAGPLPRGVRLAVATEQGEILGAVAPFGQELTHGSTTATIPVPRAAIVGGRVRLRLQVIRSGGSPRPPRPDEVGSLVLVPRAE